jgi:adenylate cyclase
MMTSGVDRSYRGDVTDDGGMTPEQVAQYLSGEHPGMGSMRRVFGHLPSDPRCKMCFAPFGGFGGMVLKPFGFGKLKANPAMCTKCQVVLERHGIRGVEIPVTMLFTDVRGSTAMGERMRPTDFHQFLHHFYRIATDEITSHDGIVDKIVGDEVIGLFIGGITGYGLHAKAGVEAALDIAERVADDSATPVGPIPAGTAVHTGEAFVGATGPAGTVDDFTALGDAVNTTARLASAARGGEVLASAATVEAAGLTAEGRECRTVDIRGRSEPVDVVVLRAAMPEAVAG